jgi:hypothetical protein
MRNMVCVEKTKLYRAVFGMALTKLSKKIFRNKKISKKSVTLALFKSNRLNGPISITDDVMTIILETPPFFPLYFLVKKVLKI